MSQIPRPRFSIIVTHLEPDADDQVAILLAEQFGEKMWPGIAQAKMRYVAAGSERFMGRNAEECERRGILSIGVLFGELDEHARPGVNGHAKGDCAALRIAKKLSIDKDPVIQHLLWFAGQANEAKGKFFDIANVVKLAYRAGKDSTEVSAWAMRGLRAKLNDPRRSNDFTLQYITMLLRGEKPDCPDEAYAWFRWAMELKFAAQQRFSEGTALDFELRAKFTDVTNPRGQLIRVVTIVSDESQIHDYAFSQGADVVIVRRTSGHYQIFSNRRTINRWSRQIFRDLVRVMRLAAMEKGGKKPLIDWRYLEAEGTIKEEPRIYVDYRGPMILNGSRTSPDTPPLNLTLEEVLSLTQLVINPVPQIPETLVSYCLAGKCVNSEKCPLRCLGLLYCRTIRFPQNHGGKKEVAREATTACS